MRNHNTQEGLPFGHRVPVFSHALVWKAGAFENIAKSDQKIQQWGIICTEIGGVFIAGVVSCDV
jgi:hypothetical protein